MATKSIMSRLSPGKVLYEVPQFKKQNLTSLAQAVCELMF
jgi:hypothetical protein